MTNKCENCNAGNMCEDVVGSCEKAINYANAIYNKALDDLRNELKTHYIEYDIDCILSDTACFSYTTACDCLESYIDKIAEELKRGRENGR